MASIFQIKEPFCLFQQTDGLSDRQLLSFARAVRSQNSAGEIESSYVGIGTISVNLQPNPAGITRLVAGTVYEVAYTFYVEGNPDISMADRCYISGQQCEVIAARHYGTEHLEADLRYMGR